MTHIPIDIDSIDWDQFLNIQEGRGSERYFVGQKYMRGYGILGNIGKFLLPIAKNIATTVGSEGIEAGTRILKDVTEGKDFNDALKEHSKKGLENLADKIKQCGKGKQKRKKEQLVIGMYPHNNSQARQIRSSTHQTLARRRKPDKLDLYF